MPDRPLGGRLGSGLASFALAGAAALAGCSQMADAPGVGKPPAPVLSVAVDSSGGPLARSLVVTTAASESVRVDYWTAGAPRLRVTAFDSGQGASVFLPRLRANATYAVEVRPVGGNGTPGDPVDDTLTTDSLPAALAAFTFKVQGSASFPLAMLELQGTFPGWVIVDSTGQVVWFHQGCPQGFTRRANGDFVFLDTCSGIAEVAPDGRVVRSLQPAYAVNHDVIATPQNTVLFLAWDPRVVNDTTWVGDAIWEWNPEAGTAVERWSALDYLSTATDRGPSSAPDDWLHANSLAIGPHGNIVVSLLLLGQVISLSPDFSRIEWRLGGPNSSFAVDSDAETYGQHTAAEVAPDLVLVFDNMTFDSLTASRHSRGLEIALDTVAGAAHEVREFRPQPDNWAPIIGSDRLLPNGDFLVSFGLSSGVDGASGPIAAYEVTPAGAVVWRLEVDGPETNYRTTALTSVGNEVEVQ